jgi:Kdo2-lipid IVA lauroyltransferase/acyltransferase
MLNYLATHLVFCIMRIITLLPYSYIMRIGYALANMLLIFPKLISRRYAIIAHNIELCFPDYTHENKHSICINCMREVLRSIIERSIIWFGSEKKVQNFVRIHGLENIPDGGAIMLGIHMVGLEAGGLALSIKFNQIFGTNKWAGLYMPQRNKIFDAVVLRQRARFGAIVVAKDSGAKPMLRHLKNNGYIQMYCDMDFGMKDSIVSKFFGHDAATITSVPRLAALSGKPVIPMLPIFDAKKSSYDLYILPALENYPHDDMQANIDILNKHFEQCILKAPHQYWWVHRRFKSTIGYPAKPNKINIKK